MTDAPPFVVAPAAPDDAAAIADFNLRLAAETEDKTLDPDIVRAGVAALLADPAKGLYFVARPAGAAANSDPVAQIMVTWEWSDWRNGAFWWVQSVYVAPGHRGRGAFRALLDRVREEAESAGAVGLRLYAERANRAALATYGKCGFSPTGYVVLER